ncbi:MAG: hypothetical protein QOF64_1026 [Candidatus Binatota bacterium]|nr:hypothetical protein [Candidatus Binatota bacterium]
MTGDLRCDPRRYTVEDYDGCGEFCDAVVLINFYYIPDGL